MLFTVGAVSSAVPEVVALIVLDREVVVVLQVDGCFVGGGWVAFLFLCLSMTT